VAGSAKRLTLKQRRFAVALVGPAKGNQAEAARIAGYAGNRRQLAVQGAVNMKNENIQKMVSEMLDGMAQHALERLAEGLDAIKMKSFVAKGGEVLKGDPEVDHSSRLRSIEIWHRLRQETGSGGADDVAHPTNNPGLAARPEVVAMSPADRTLLREAGQIEEELAEVDRQLAEEKDKDGSGGEGQS
jgi:hypothetical protein